MRYLILIFCLLVTLIYYSQDTLTFLNGEKAVVKILVIENKCIKYNFLDYINGPIITTNKNNLSKISFGNGRVEKYDTITVSDQEKNENLIFYGTMDAYLYYVEYRKKLPLIFFSTVFFTPILSYLPSKYLANKKIKENLRPKGYTSYDNLEGPSKYTYYNNPIYISSFVIKAKNKQKKRIWATYVIGSIFSAGFWTILGLQY